MSEKTTTAEVEPEVEAESEEAIAAQEAAERAAFDKALDKEESEQPAPDEDPEANEDADEDEEVDAETETEDSEESDQPDLSEITSDNDVRVLMKDAGLSETDSEGALAKAIDATRRDGYAVSDDEIAELFDKNPKSFIERGLKAAKRQADQDAFGRKASKWKKDAESKTEPKEADPKEEAATSPAKEVITKALEGISTEEHPELGEKLTSALLGIVDKIESDAAAKAQVGAEALDARSQSLDDQIEEVRIARIGMAIDRQRDLLSKDIPALKDPKKHQRVLDRYEEQADTLHLAGKSDTITAEELYEESARHLYGQETQNSLANKLMRRSKDERRGQPRAKAAGTTQKTSDEKERAAFDAIMEQHNELPEH